jgi:hypothetical protein
MPAADHTPSGILALGSNFYEFIPEQEADSARPTILLSHELEANCRYSILLTTPGGLYRYRIQDIVEVTGFYNRAPLISFVRKEGEMTSITGEKLHVNHLILALDEVRRCSSLDIEQFRAAPDEAGNCYHIYLEIKGHASPAVLRNEVLPLIDGALAKVNVEYAQKRASRRLGAPRLHLMRAGWGSEISRRQIIAGKRDTQYKWALLCPEPRPEDAPFIMATIEAVDENARAASFSEAA